MTNNPARNNVLRVPHSNNNSKTRGQKLNSCNQTMNSSFNFGGLKAQSTFDGRPKSPIEYQRPTSKHAQSRGVNQAFIES